MIEGFLVAFVTVFVAELPDKTMVASLIAQRITDEGVRVRWFRGPLGRELSRLAGSPGEHLHRPAASASAPGELAENDMELLWLLVEGWTNREIEDKLGVSEDDLGRRLTEMYAKIGVSSRGEAAVFALREKVV